LIALDCIYPFAAIDDPNLMMELDILQTTYTSIDAFCHAIETSTTKIQSPYSIHLARDAIRLIAEYLPRARKDLKDKQARYWLTYASGSFNFFFPEIFEICSLNFLFSKKFSPRWYCI